MSHATGCVDRQVRVQPLCMLVSLDRGCVDHQLWSPPHWCRLCRCCRVTRRPESTKCYLTARLVSWTTRALATMQEPYIHILLAYICRLVPICFLICVRGMREGLVPRNVCEGSHSTSGVESHHSPRSMLRMIFRNYTGCRGAASAYRVTRAAVVGLNSLHGSQ